MPVYMIQAGDGGPVKIGWSTDVDDRLRAIQTGSPVALALLRTIDAHPIGERLLHQQYAHLRQRGEWFTFCPTMLTTGIPAAQQMEARPSKAWHNRGLARWLQETGTTLTEFANRIGEDVSTCHNWMTGRRNPRAAALAKIDEATKGKVRPADFVNEIAG